ncbi:MAG: membrane protein insertion efficiency factor YidD [Longimonas sp.]|uniref:membrane protein insertion efficiency factor YidD n=1 Tax=Longimonas sp. TaxID=2039626 RepID=UPI00335DF495
METIRTAVYQIGRTLWQLPRHLLLGLLWVYRNAISPFTPPTCRFHPTCSSYAEQALREYGAVKGLILTIYRVGRCHPLGGSGYDPPRWFGEAPPDRDRGTADHEAQEHTCENAPTGERSNSPPEARHAS